MLLPVHHMRSLKPAREWAKHTTTRREIRSRLRGQPLAPARPHRIKRWSLTSLQQRLVTHARYYWLLLAEGHLTRRLFGDMLRRIWALPVPTG